MPPGLPRRRISPATGEVLPEDRIPEAIRALGDEELRLEQEREALIRAMDVGGLRQRQNVEQEQQEPPQQPRRPRSTAPRPHFTKAWWDPEREGHFLVYKCGNTSETYFLKFSWYTTPEFNLVRRYDETAPPWMRGPNLYGLLHSAAFKYGFKDSDAFMNHLKTLQPLAMDLSKDIPEVVEPPVKDDTGKTLWDHLDED